MVREGTDLQDTYGFITEKGLVPKRFVAIPMDMPIRRAVEYFEGDAIAGPLPAQHGLELDEILYQPSPADYAGFEFSDGSDYDWDSVYMGFDGVGRLTSVEFREDAHRVKPGVSDPVTSVNEPLNGNGTTLRDLLSGEVDDQALMELDTVPDYDDPAALLDEDLDRDAGGPSNVASDDSRSRSRLRGLLPSLSGIGPSFSIRSFLVVLLASLVAVIAGGSIPIVGSIGRFLGLFAVAFGAGLVSSRSRYLEVALAGAVAAGAAFLLGTLTSIFAPVAVRVLADYGVAIVG
jgi:hypothetical protein